MKNSSKNTLKGFTLIEMIVVIVILGILSATAMPRFIALSGDACAAKMMAYYGAISSAAELANARCEIDLGIGKSGTNCDNGTKGYITMGSAKIEMVYKYPNATWLGIDNATNMFTSIAAQKAAGFELGDSPEDGGGGAGITQKIILTAATDKTRCYVSYTSSEKLGDPPKITFDTSGC